MRAGKARWRSGQRLDVYRGAACDKKTSVNYSTSPPIGNVRDILRLGLRSHHLMRGEQHQSVADEEVQAIRARKDVPGGRPLHDYVNLYLCARNPMMYKLHKDHADLCVLRVSRKVLGLQGVVITDGNAASAYVSFWPSPTGLSHIDVEFVFAERWTDDDQFIYWRKKKAKCAEVLVPDRVDPSFVDGAYVSGPEGRNKLILTDFGPPVTVDAHLFFAD